MMARKACLAIFTMEKSLQRICNVSYGYEECECQTRTCLKKYETRVIAQPLFSKSKNPLHMRLAI